MASTTCPWCAEEIRAEALKCRWCGSRVRGGLRDPAEWHRSYPERKLAGVCASVAHNLSVSVTAVRAVFLLLALFHGLGLVLYAALWVVLPEQPGEASLFDRAGDALRTLFGADRRSRPADDPRDGIREDREDDADRWSRTRN